MNHLETQTIINSELLLTRLCFCQHWGRSWMKGVDKFHSQRTCKGKPHDWQDTNTASNQREPAEPDHKRIKRRQTVWIAYLQTKERPNCVAIGRHVQMGALRRRHIPAVALQLIYLELEMLPSQGLFFIITNIYSKYKIRAGGWIKNMLYTNRVLAVTKKTLSC